MAEVRELRFGCCFCGEEIESPDDFQIVGVWDDGKEQTWWCHQECFAAALQPEFRVFRGEE